MFSVFVSAPNTDDPLAALELGDRPEPEAADGWTRVQVKAASLNHHDVWSLKGQGLPADRMPMILGTDAAGVDEDGNEVLIHSVISSPGWTGDETYDPKRSLLSEVHQGTFAEYVSVPKQNLVAKPAELSFEEASCLPTAWLTAYRMLTKDSGLKPGDTVLIQGASGGVASAATALAKTMGLQVWVTGRSEEKRQGALENGAHQVFESGARLPGKVDAVLETVGEATWSHSLRSLRPGGTIVCCGATSGFNPPADLARVFFLQMRIIGSTMGDRTELAALLNLLKTTGLRPTIDKTLPLKEAKEGFQAMVDGNTNGKIVFTV
ncbi:zinc-binding dehydrogenase [Cumulibacter manganitolerans]|uniref:zinc-binding dehydrogenase n=1 Tax=Cumulibacter manganitolerans TaxID=1884992 RepID=UPI00129657F4|nr:zinc-binding dehydrogenase [Cumulibacter manganitolerans]